MLQTSHCTSAGCWLAGRQAVPFRNATMALSIPQEDLIKDRNKSSDLSVGRMRSAFCFQWRQNCLFNNAFHRIKSPLSSRDSLQNFFFFTPDEREKNPHGRNIENAYGNRIAQSLLIYVYMDPFGWVVRGGMSQHLQGLA